jgi:hypothetical protein
MFYKLGHNVYTASWATKLNAVGARYEIPYNLLHNKKHFYQEQTNFLGEEEQKILSKIDINWPEATTIYPDVGQVLVSNFDVLYVSQIVSWLLYYAILFLKAGKKVIFRTYGYNFGRPQWFLDLFQFPTMVVVPTYNSEMYLYTDCRHTQPVFLSMREELIDTSLIKDNGYAFAIVNGGSPTYWNQSKKLLEVAGIPLEVFDHCINGWISNEEQAKKYGGCRLYIDFWKAPAKSVTLEAMLYNKPTLMFENGSIHSAMLDTGFQIGNAKCLFTNFRDQVELVKILWNSTDMRQEIVGVQKEWRTMVTKNTEEAWKEILK